MLVLVLVRERELNLDSVHRNYLPAMALAALPRTAARPLPWAAKVDRRKSAAERLLVESAVSKWKPLVEQRLVKLVAV